MAAGVSAVYAPFSSSLCSRGSIPAERKTAIELPCSASRAMLSHSGTGVRPAMRVRITVWLTPGSVYSAFRAAAAPQKLETPGVTSYLIPSSSSRSICSRIAP